MSETSTAGAAFTFAVDGNGFAIMGGNNGSAVIDVYVDGVLKAENAATKLPTPAVRRTFCPTLPPASTPSRLC